MSCVRGLEGEGKPGGVTEREEKEESGGERVQKKKIIFRETKEKGKKGKLGEGGEKMEICAD